MEKEYITPTNQSPVFTAHNNWAGYIENTFYKRWEINNNCGHTFALNFVDAINGLHEWIKEHKETVLEYPKSKFFIDAVHGDLDKNGNPIRIKVYEISTKKAIKYIL